MRYVCIPFIQTDSLWVFTQYMDVKEFIYTCTVEMKGTLHAEMVLKVGLHNYNNIINWRKNII